jgi:type IV pilus assembly protein PilQ
MKTIYVFIFSIFAAYFSLAQSKNEEKYKINNIKDVKISFFKDTPIIEAIDQIDTLVEKLEHKKILVISDVKGDIGLDIEREYYRQALSKIALNNNLDIEENDSTISLSKKNDNPLDAPQVNISAIFFEADITQMKQRGINWDLLLSKSGLIINPNFSSGSVSNTDSLSPAFKLGLQSAADLGKFSSYTSALLNFVESENLGRVLAKLSLTVRDGKEGAIQVGSDFSVKQYDFAGNVLDRFYPTGTIIKVTPHVHKEDTLYYALLNLNVEKSAFEPGTPNNEILKETANTDVLLLNDEEAIVGGLTTGTTVNYRGGIPGLKDLPWWVFGLKYLFGFDQQQYVESEVIILVKIEVIPTLRERMIDMQQNLIDKKIKDDHMDFEKYKIKSLDSKKSEE